MTQRTSNSASRNMLAKTIAGEITLAENAGTAMKKWRMIFGIKQKDLAKNLRMSPSVISDYESGRRRPGVGFVKKYTHALVKSDQAMKGMLEKLILPKKSEAVLDIREFLKPASGEELIKQVKGKILANKEYVKNNIYGYTVIDSIKAILELSDKDFTQIYGMNNQRALIFTKVHLGRSPMIAVKVTHPKPAMVVFHGLSPGEVDKLAIRIAETQKIPLVVSMAGSEEELIEGLRKIEG